MACRAAPRTASTTARVAVAQDEDAVAAEVEEAAAVVGVDPGALGAHLDHAAETRPMRPGRCRCARRYSPRVRCRRRGAARLTGAAGDIVMRRRSSGSRWRWLPAVPGAASAVRPVLRPSSQVAERGPAGRVWLRRVRVEADRRRRRKGRSRWRPVMSSDEVPERWRTAGAAGASSNGQQQPVHGLAGRSGGGAVGRPRRRRTRTQRSTDPRTVGARLPGGQPVLAPVTSSRIRRPIARATKSCGTTSISELGGTGQQRHGVCDQRAEHLVDSLELAIRPVTESPITTDGRTMTCPGNPASAPSVRRRSWRPR